MVHLISAIVALKTVTLVLGGLITFFAYRAYRRTGSSALRTLFVGFGVVTLGSLAAGMVDQFTGLPADYALITESALTAAGFAIILYSLYAE